jgi:hypothetical protein
MWRVTEVLDKYSDFSKVNPTVLENACKRGTKAHKVCTDYALGMLLGEPDPDVAGYFQSFKHWYDENVLECLDAEFELKGDAFRLVGHPDLRVRLHTFKTAIIDIKTPIAGSKLWSMQLGAYWYLAEQAGIRVDRIGSLRVDKNGKDAKLTWYDTDTKTGITAFLNALSAHVYVYG